MVSAAVISSKAFLSKHQNDAVRRVTLALENEETLNNGTELIDHLRIAARASFGGSTRMATIKRSQSMKINLKPSKDERLASSSLERKQKKKKKGFFEFGPFRFISSSKDEGKRLRSSLQRQDTIGIQKPGLRAMLYGLTLKMEKEEKMQKKLTKKRES